jgi:hypothetical protein
MHAARPAPAATRPRWHALGAAALTLAVAALALAEQAIDTWTEAHLFLAWLIGWAVVFAATALLDSWNSHRRGSRDRPRPARVQVRK